MRACRLIADGRPASIPCCRSRVRQVWLQWSRHRAFSHGWSLGAFGHFRSVDRSGSHPASDRFSVTVDQANTSVAASRSPTQTGRSGLFAPGSGGHLPRGAGIRRRGLGDEADVHRVRVRINGASSRTRGCSHACEARMQRGRNTRLASARRRAELTGTRPASAAAATA